MEIKIPETSLVLLIGASGSGKSTFARKHFRSTEIVSSDACRGIVSDNENNLDATNDAFELVHFIIGKRLRNGLLTVVDATNVQAESRQKLLQLSKEHHVLPSAIVFDLPQEVCAERDEKRPDRTVGGRVIYRQRQQLKKSLSQLKREGFRKVHIFNSADEVDAVAGIERERLYNNKKDEHGPFDIIGDVHGCLVELIELLEKLGYGVHRVPETDEPASFGFRVVPPAGRKVVFVGDLVDRGPDSPGALKLAMSMVGSGTALCVPGNHDAKLLKWLNGKKVKLNYGLDKTVEQLAGTSENFKEQLREFLSGLISHYVLDGGNLVIAHAGLPENMHGRASGAVRSFCLYGDTTGEKDAFGLPVRRNWALDYRGRAKVVFGHTPVPEAAWLNNAIDIDTGCVFGGKLTALRYPEGELVEVAAKEQHAVPSKPMDHPSNSFYISQNTYDDLLDIDDVSGKLILHTRLRNNVTIREEHSIAALEVMSRFALNPKWLIYLPPTMSPCAASELEGYLEHPLQAINYYRKRGVQTLVCEEKHMGSRAVVVLCRDETIAADRFGVAGDGFGKCYTRTGRNFFNDSKLEEEFMLQVREGLTRANFWQKFKTDWVCLDCELMPWSAKARALLQDQYAAVGAAATRSLSRAEEVLRQAKERNLAGAEEMWRRYRQREAGAGKFIDAYRQYCWPVHTIADYKLAPFHILATEGKVHVDQTHEWQMKNLRDIVEQGESIFCRTNYKMVDTTSEESIHAAVEWWLSLTDKGGEGMVVKPLDFVTHGDRDILQPAVKCRGKEYLRIIYGPEYDAPEHLQRLRKRGLNHKRSLALREFALGVEALERFVRREPLRRVHESVFGVLALESEEVDPRL